VAVIRTYLPAIVFLVLGTGVGILFVSVSSLIGPKRKTRPTTYQGDPYESGMPSESQQGFRFGISFYLIAMLFILFDIEVVFLYPIAVQLRTFGTFALIETVVFIALLVVAFVYVWRRGALEWS
jgi:NADH-quinone oxidoreductase subunit A